MNDFIAFLKLYKWRIISVCIGILITVLLLTIGFWRTLLIAVIVGVAYFLGMLLDQGGRARVKAFFAELFRRGNE